MTIDLMIFDHLHLSRLALAALLEQCDEFRIAASVDSTIAALEYAESHRPDVAVISFDGRSKETIEIARKIAGVPGCSTLVLASTFTRSVVREAYTSEIAGMVRQSDSPHRLFEAVRLAHRGERVFDAELTVAALVNEDCPLTLRQLCVLEYLSLGDTVIEIARRLCLSEGTVRNYISSVVAKLGARNRIDALRIAQDSHWI
jgi:two-component system response regulator DesR